MGNRTHDSQCAIELVENSMEKAKAEGIIVKEVIADTCYDTHEIFKHLTEREIKPVIKVRRKAVVTGSRARDRTMGCGRPWHVDEEFFIS